TRGRRVRRVRRDRADPFAAARPAPRRPDARARGVTRGPDAGGGRHRRRRHPAGGARAHVARAGAPRALAARGAVRGLGGARGGEATTDRLKRLRRTLAGLEVPLTLERAPWSVRCAVGHFGAYREGVGPLVAGLRRTFDPGEAFVVAAEGAE